MACSFLGQVVQFAKSGGSGDLKCSTFNPPPSPPLTGPSQPLAKHINNTSIVALPILVLPDGHHTLLVTSVVADSISQINYPNVTGRESGLLAWDETSDSDVGATNTARGQDEEHTHRPLLWCGATLVLGPPPSGFGRYAPCLSSCMG